MFAFLIVVFIFVIIALGMAKLVGPFIIKPTRTKPRNRDPLPREPELRALILALRNEGYYGRNRVADEDIEYVDNPVLTEMIEDLAKRHDLRWKLPMFRLRIRKNNELMPDWVNERYTHALLTPTHGIGFNVTPHEEDVVYS